MKDLVAMRHKYWSGVQTLWPAKKSTVAVPFCWEGFKINACCLEMAQEMARQGKFNGANYLLTAAYAVGTRNDDFWNQFI